MSKSWDIQHKQKLNVSLLLQVTSAAQHQTTQAPSSAPGPKLSTDPTPPCSWWRQNGEAHTTLNSDSCPVVEGVCTNQFVFVPVIWRTFPVWWLLTDPAFSARMPAARSERSSTASPSASTSTATPAWRNTQRASTWETSVSDCI